MLLLTVSLICIAVAFVAGWLLSKICLTGPGLAGAVSRDRLHSLLHGQRDRYRQRIASLYKLVQRHEKRRGEIEHKLAVLEKALESRAASEEAAKAMLKAEQTRALEIQNELGLLRIQRDALIAKAERHETSNRQGARRNPDNESARVAELREELGKLRSELATRDHQLQRLEQQIAEITERENQALTRLSEWKRRVKPLTQQLRLQRDVIRKLRDAPEPCPAETRVVSMPLPVVDEHPDDLKKIRGIGPALERRLLAHGISRYAQIAEMGEEELARVAAELAIAPHLPARDRWIEQARNLHGQRTDRPAGKSESSTPAEADPILLD